MKIHPLKNWIPVKLDFSQFPAVCYWLYLAEKRFEEPFFQDTLSQCAVLKENSQKFKSSTSLESLLEFEAVLPDVIPKAIIFHISRCGSTLYSQLLALEKQNVLISEAPILDEVLRELNYKNTGFDADKLRQVFKSVINLLGQKRSSEEESLIIKLDCWHLFYFEFIRSVYPNTPFVISVRKPDEVINSHLKERGMHMVPGLIEPELLGFIFEDSVQLSPSEYICAVLETYFVQIQKIIRTDTNSLIVDYNAGIWDNFSSICDFIGFDISEQFAYNAKARLGFHSKRPGMYFDEPKIEVELSDYQRIVTGIYESLFSKNISE